MAIRSLFAGFALSSILFACGAPPTAPKPVDPAPPEVAATATTELAVEPPPVPIAPLRTGALAPDKAEVVALRAAEKGSFDGDQILRVPIAVGVLGGQLHGHAFSGEGTIVSVEGELGFSGALVEAGQTSPDGPPKYELWLRRDAGKVGQPANAELHVPPHGNEGPALVVPITVAVDGANQARLDDGWRRALGSHLGTRSLRTFSRFGRFSHFAAFAAERLGTPKSPASSWDTGFDGWPNWAALMELTSGVGSVRTALQEDSHLRSEIDRFRPTLPMSSLSGPTIRRHPWKAMHKGLEAATPPSEPLAEATPAAFYYVRAEAVDVLFELLDEIEAWGTPLMHLVEGRSEDMRLSERYRLSLGLPGSELSKLLGPEAITRLALVGSDPFLRQGSDLTLIAEAKSAALLRTGFDRELKSALAGRGTPEKKSVDHHGVTISITRSADGAVSQHRASQGDLHVISNSLGAIQRVIDTIGGRSPALSGEPDFQYMMARDPEVPSQVLVYAGDRFIESVVGPRSRILDARRQVAGAELETPVFAALLHGWLFGEVPKDRKALMATKLLGPDDLRHFDRAAITFEPGSAPHSSWGRPGMLTPLIDLPDPKRITKTEKEAYQQFARNYEMLWSDALDPIALRVSLDEVEGRRELRAKLRVLPLLRDRDYMQLNELVGNSHIHPGARRDGARFIFAIAPDSELRRELTRTSRAMLGGELKLDWVGDYGMVGILDRPELANALHEAGLAPELPAKEDPDEMAALMKLPLYVALDVKQRTTAAMMITVLRAKLADEGDFSSHGEHRGTTIVEAQVDRDVRLYYALSDRALYLALQPWVIEQLLDLEAAGGLPNKPEPGAPRPGQATFEVMAEPEGGLFTALSWLFERQAPAFDGRQSAEMLLVGAPATRRDPSAYASLALAYFGAIPKTVDGRPYELRPSGAADPKRGNPYERRYPELPVAGSPAATVLDALELFRAQIGFDPEPMPVGAQQERSLSVGMTIGRR